MATQGLEWILAADAKQFVTGTAKAAAAAQRFEKQLEQVTGGRVKFDHASRRFVDTETKQVIPAFEKEAAALAKVKMAHEAAGRSSSQHGHALRGLGYMMNDAQQFSLGMSQGVRAISNNVGMLALGLGASGGLVFGLEAAMTAMAFFGDKVFGAKKEVADLTKEIDGLLDSLLNFSTGDRLKVAPENLPGFMAGISARLRELGAGDLEQLGRVQQKIKDINASIKAESKRDSLNQSEINKLLAARTELEREEETLKKRTAHIDKERVRTLERVLQKAAETRLVHVDEERIMQDLLDAGAEVVENEERKNTGVREGIRLRQLEYRVILAQTKLLREGDRRGRFRVGGPKPLDREPNATPRRRNALGEEEIFTSGPLRGFSDSVITEMEAAQKAFDESLRNMRISYKGFANNFLRDHEHTIGGFADGFGQFAAAAEMAFAATGERSKGLFAAMKAMAIAEATINTYLGATKALAQGGVAGPFLAAGIIAAGLAYVATIAATNPGAASGGASGGTGVQGSQAATRAAQIAAWDRAGIAHPGAVTPVSGFASGPQMVVVHVEGRVSGRDLDLVQANRLTADSKFGRRTA